MNILILGRGKSAYSLYNVLSKEHFVSFAIEDYEKLDNNSIYKKDVDIDKYDKFFVSPGVKNDDLLYLKLKGSNKDISSEIEYALDKLKNHKIIAITGSNGKTTVASLLHHVLTKKGVKNVVCGNIGDPLINYINVDLDTLIILEISSFQLERINFIKPYISIITNITPNHLDRHTFKDYVNIKKKVYLYQDNNDYLIINKETYSIYNIESNSNIIISKKKKIKSKHLIGNHNYINIGYVIDALKILNIKDYYDEIKSFKGVKYRLEFLGKINNTNIYNDAKSSTIYSTIEALKSVGSDTLLILGGRNKDIDYSIINNYKVKQIVMYGEEKDKTSLDVIKFNNLKEAFKYAINNQSKFKNILYSPGFTSFDQYNNYNERGEEFERLFNQEINNQ